MSHFRYFFFLEILAHHNVNQKPGLCLCLVMDDEPKESVMVATLDSSNFQLVTWSARIGYSMNNFPDDINHQVVILPSMQRQERKHPSVLLELLPQQLNPSILSSHFNGQPQL